jgi:murein DD-endopeptidase MepM/ murein hydrolase activator NlpD
MRRGVCLHPYMKKKHAERRWTVMLVPHGSGSSRAVEVSQTVVKALIGIGGVVALLFLVLGGAALSRGVNVTKSRGLERENQLLASEIQRLRERLVGLRDTLNVFSEREQALRLLAGLNPIDQGVRQAGIGGPSGQWSERDSLSAAGPNGRQALAARIDMDQLTRRANILVRSLNEAYDSASSQRSRYAALPSIMPTKGWLTSAFAREREHPVLHLARPHEGIDLSAPMGMDIEAPAAGVVTQVSWVEGYGNMLTIDHGYGLVTRYAHCSKILVVRGQRVKRGQQVAKVGNTGLSTGPHLHYEVWVNGRPVNPMKYVLPDAIVD